MAMTPRPASVNLGASRTDVSARSPGDSDSDSADELETSRPVGESYDDSLEAILLQAGARPPEPATSKLLGSKTLMGIGIEGLNLAGIRAAAEDKGDKRDKDESKGSTETAAHEDGDAAMHLDDLIEAGGANRQAAPTVAPRPAALLSSEETPEVTSLLDDVAQALNVQANEYRDRARGRLPGMPSPAAATARAPSQSKGAKGATERIEAEFEDPDDSPTSLTPGSISVVDEHDVEVRVASSDESPDGSEGDAVVLPASAPGSTSIVKDAKSGPRAGGLPPLPGLFLAPAPIQVGPPPGLPPRAATPPSGLAPPPSGRVRLPTPIPGLPVPALPAPALGRLTLPPGTMSPVAAPGIELSPAATSAPMSIDTSRSTSARNTGAPDAGRVSARRNARITEQVRPVASPLPAILTAHVKLATVSLAGLVAVTFAGGLFVGMLVWKGQSRGEPGLTGRAATAGTVPASARTAAIPTAGANIPPTTAGTTTAGTTTAGTTVAMPGAANPGAPIPSGGPPAAIVAPLAASPESAEPLAAAPKPVRRPAVIARPRRPAVAPAPTVADATALFPKTPAAKPVAAKPAATAGGTASKPMANNAAPKPVVKSKPKTTWHDPFAD